MFVQAPPLAKGEREEGVRLFYAPVAPAFADYLGLAVLTPALPYYLRDKLGLSIQAAARWNGLITTAQFSGVVVGNLLSGGIADRIGAKSALQLSLVGDMVFFSLTALMKH